MSKQVAATFLAVVVLLSGDAALGNHPVFVEGNCFGPGVAQRTAAPSGTCGDYDGDGFVGPLEDTDEADRVFGTINAALGPGTGAAAGTGANQNGRVTVVTSGVFPEIVTITAANGNVTLEGAPGVEATIDAIVQGVPGGAARQTAPGLLVNAPDNRKVIIRNITVRNFAIGILIQGDSHVVLENVRVENNANWGILVQDNARVTIARSQVHATGFRVGAGTDAPGPATPPNIALTPAPGVGIEFQGSSSGSIFSTTVTGSFSAGVLDGSGGLVCASHVQLFDNNPNTLRLRSGGQCDGFGR